MVKQEETGKHRIFLGGAYLSSPSLGWNMRVGYQPPTLHDNDIGFRVVIRKEKKDEKTDSVLQVSVKTVLLPRRKLGP